MKLRFENIFEVIIEDLKAKEIDGRAKILSAVRDMCSGGFRSVNG